MAKAVESQEQQGRDPRVVIGIGGKTDPAHSRWRWECEMGMVYPCWYLVHGSSAYDHLGRFTHDPTPSSDENSSSGSTNKRPSSEPSARGRDWAGYETHPSGFVVAACPGFGRFRGAPPGAPKRGIGPFVSGCLKDLFHGVNVRASKRTAEPTVSPTGERTCSNFCSVVLPLACLGWPQMDPPQCGGRGRR